MLRDGDKEQATLCFAYLLENTPDKNQFYNDLARLFVDCSASGRIRMIGILDSAKELPEALLNKVGTVLPAMDSYYEVHLFLGLLEKHDCVSEPLLTMISQLLEDANFFIARRAYWYLDKQTVDEQTASRIRSFREESEKDGRILK